MMLASWWEGLMQRIGLRPSRRSLLQDEVDRAKQRLRRAQHEKERATHQARASCIRSLTATEQARDALADLAGRMKEGER